MHATFHKKINLQRFLYVVLFLFLPLSSFASHIIGGNLGYRYLGLQPNGKYRYVVTLVTFTDCSPSSQIPVPESSVRIGIFREDPFNPMSDKLLHDSLLLPLIHSQTYTPNLPPGCTVGQNSCITRGDYEAVIDLDAATGGYHLFYERCCRNVGIINLQPNQSASFYTFIPPTSVVNSSPQFTEDPIPFVCINDPILISNLATDIDGDSLVYSFSTPLNGFGDQFNTIPLIPNPALNWPIPPVAFVPGFAFNTPFGNSGSASINSSTGLSSYTIPIPGPYVVCVEVREYRNGQLIGIIRRDVQLLAMPCPINNSPQLVQNLQTDYQTETGDTICFPVTFQDPENDSVFLDDIVSLFDTSTIAFAPTFTITSIDSNKVSGNFCWIIPCDADTGEFNFLLETKDNGCPPKQNRTNYAIRVSAPQKPVIAGPDTVCETADSIRYSVNSPPDYQYTWQAVNGTIVHQENNYADISWNTGSGGQVIIHSSNKFGCVAGSDTFDVAFIPVPVLTAMPDDSLCESDSIQLSATGSVPVFYWYPENNLIDPLSASPTAIVDSSGWYYVAALPGRLCPPSDSVFLTVWPKPDPSATSDSSWCALDTVFLSASGGIEYRWTPSIGLSSDTIPNPFFIAHHNTVYVVEVIDSNQCSEKDTVEIMVNPLPQILTDTLRKLCMGDTIQLMASGGINYDWSPADYLSGTSVSNPFAWPPATQEYQLTVTDSNHCSSDTAVWIEVSPSPLASFNTLPVSASCSGFIVEFENTSTGGDQYHWNFGDGDTTNAFSPVHTFIFGQEYIVYLTVYNSFQCDAEFTDTITVEDLSQFVHYEKVNAFSPNGDGINDVLDFSFPAEFLDCSRLYVYNRWGVLVFNGEMSDPKWNGLSGSQPVPEGTYFWIIDINGIHFNGNVMLFR